MTLGVFWDGQQIGRLTRTEERSRDYSFEYTDPSRTISLSLPARQEHFIPAETRPFFEALLPEGAVRDQMASQFKLAASDSYGLLAELGRDCAGALQIVAQKRMSDPPAVRWLSAEELDKLIEDLPRHPFGVRPEDGRLRLSLAGVQRKAVLVRDEEGRFGEPLSGMPSTHILKPDLPGCEDSNLATNEYFCMKLADRCGLPVANVELMSIAGRSCVVVERYDRDRTRWPPGRVHQEDLCQALGLTPDFKYQRPGESVPSYRALADLLDAHSAQPGVDRLNAARGAIFNLIVGNADAHAKNISLLHENGGVALAPMYDLVSTAAYPQLTDELSLSIGDEFDPARVSLAEWGDLAIDLHLQPRAFGRERRRLASLIAEEALALRDEALQGQWHHETLDAIVDLVETRAARAAA